MASLPAGLTSAIIDETLGGLNYVLKREGVIGSGPSFTVHLEVDYKKPVPSESTVICTAALTSIEGRKAWVAATVQVGFPHCMQLKKERVGILAKDCMTMRLLATCRIALAVKRMLWGRGCS